jgi:ABC-type polysaccharide/polyol phosphate transport system ATPase subunit
MEHVYKKFRKGEIYNSLRDLIPALTGQMFRQQDLSGSDKREFWALQDLSFEVKRGEAFGIIGHNGAGKSTALKILGRIMKPTKGRMVVNGRLSALIEVTAGFHQDLTGRENIFLHGTILGMTKREIESKLDQIIAFSGIEEFIDTPVKRYSSGMYARLGFSVAAHVNPDVLIVDEVLSVGDWLFQVKCIERMKEVIRSGATVLFVSHNLKTIGELCHRCLLLERGHTVTVGPVQEVIPAYLKGSQSAHDGDADSRPVMITKVQVRNKYGECVRFQSGEKAWIDVELRALGRCRKLSVSLFINDDQFRSVFDTNTERLGHGNFNLDEGDVYTCTFELHLNLANCIFYPSITIFRDDTPVAYDRWAVATTIYVSSDDGGRGPAQCFPRITQQEIHAASETTNAHAAREPADAGKRNFD